MAEFISADQLDGPGAKTANESADRAEAAQKLAAADMGGAVEIHRTMGQYAGHMVAVSELAERVL